MSAEIWVSPLKSVSLMTHEAGIQVERAKLGSEFEITIAHAEQGFGFKVSRSELHEFVNRLADLAA